MGDEFLISERPHLMASKRPFRRPFQRPEVNNNNKEKRQCWRCSLATPRTAHLARAQPQNHCEGCEYRKPLSMRRREEPQQRQQRQQQKSRPPQPESGKPVQVSPHDDDRHEETDVKLDVNKLNLSFGGCGFMGIYHVGVAAAIKTLVPNAKFGTLAGCSAGALAATCLLADISPSKY